MSHLGVWGWVQYIVLADTSCLTQSVSSKSREQQARRVFCWGNTSQGGWGEPGSLTPAAGPRRGWELEPTGVMACSRTEPRRNNRSGKGLAPVSQEWNPGRLLGYSLPAQISNFWALDMCIFNTSRQLATHKTPGASLDLSPAPRSFIYRKSSHKTQ